MESKVKNENFIAIQGFMVNELNLKGNELIVYACIYGFSQAENQVFNGSLQYLADWTNSTKQGVVKNLKSLEEKGYIIKKENYFNNVKFVEYYTTKFNGGMQHSCMGGMQHSLPNNIDINKIECDNIDKEKIDKKESCYSEIIRYLNLKAHTHYMASTPDTRKHIKARLDEGFTVDDFKKVIDKKCAEWLGTEQEQYLRPPTLFSTKFESYLNSTSNKKIYGENGIEIKPREYDELDRIF